MLVLRLSSNAALAGYLFSPAMTSTVPAEVAVAQVFAAAGVVRSVNADVTEVVTLAAPSMAWTRK